MQDPVDAHVGARLRHARLAAQVSQQELAHVLGVSAERIQRYECGAERVGAGRLYLACRRLNVPPTYFFEGYEGPAAGEDPALAGSGPIAEPEERSSRLAVDRLIDQIMQRIRNERSGA